MPDVDRISSPSDPIASRSPALVAFFGRVLTRAMASDFHAVRLSGHVPDLPRDRPAVIYTNHPSWWDPAFFAVLTTRKFPERRGYGPIDAEALARYRFMSRIGLFAVEATSRRGPAHFLRSSARILQDPRSILWITPEGRFTDPRERPVRLQPGLAHLARRHPQAVFVPMALEYPFWGERQPEALCRFGARVDAGAHPGLSVAEWSALLTGGLTETMELLAADAIARDPRRFEVLLEGRAGVGGIYDLWRRLRAAVRHERFRPEHGRF
jgi:1-acyl-sn-glycerol-3-phosphate acyltransferase